MNARTEISIPGSRHQPARGALLALALAAGALASACGAAAPVASSPAPASASAAAASVPASAPAGQASAASKPAEASTAAISVADQASWDKVVAAAQQEGTVALSLQPGDPFRAWMADFQKAYPGIKLEISQQNGRDFVSRITPERQAGKYAWDAYIGGSETGYGSLEPPGFLDPLKPVVRPEIADNSKWLSGFDGGFVDKAGQFVYNVEGDVVPTVHINRDVIPESQLNRVEDINDAKWKGKLSVFDPRASGNGAATGAHWVMVKGGDWWRQVLELQPAISADYRQQEEWVVRGQYPIAIAGNNRILPDFQKQGLGLNVKPLAFDSEMGHRLNQSVSLALINKRPHPNAAAVFMNWLLSQDGQTSFVKTTEQASRRLDAPKGPPGSTPDPAVKYLPSVNAESSANYVAEATKIAKEVLK